MKCVFVICFLVGFCNAEDKICDRMLQRFYITGLKLNYTQATNFDSNDVSCEATYEYHDNEMLELTCMKMIGVYERAYESMEFSYKEFKKTENLYENRDQAKYYYINRTFEIQNVDDEKKIECKVKSFDSKGRPRQESLVIKLIWKPPPESPTPKKPNIDQNSSSTDAILLMLTITASCALVLLLILICINRRRTRRGLQKKNETTRPEYDEIPILPFNEARNLMVSNMTAPGSTAHPSGPQYEELEYSYAYGIRPDQLK